MQLSIAELARLELMFASGQVRSDPPTLSATDRMMEAMTRAANVKAGLRSGARRPAADHQALEQRSREAAPTREAGEPRAAGESGLDWNEPRSLEELIQIRQALLRNEEPGPRGC